MGRVMLAVLIGLLVATPAVAGEVTLIANGVANLTSSATLFTVPASQRFLVTDVVISKDGVGAACCARLFENNATAMTAFISVPARIP